MVELVPKDLLAALLGLRHGGVRVNPEWGGHGSLAINRVRARIKVRLERAHNGPWRRCITAPRTKEKHVTNQVIPAEAVELSELMHEKITERLPANPTKDQIAAYVDAAVGAAIHAGFGKVTT